jgi:hypothetical protein
MRRLNPKTQKLFECGETRDVDPKNKNRTIFRSYSSKTDRNGFNYELWETFEKFNARKTERKNYIIKYTLDPVNRAKYIWSRTRDKAKSRKIGFYITVDDIIPALKRGVCDMTGLLFNLNRPNVGSSTHPYAPSIDRINSNKDYTKDNIRVVLWAVNAATNQFTDEEMLPILKAMVSTMEKNVKQKPTSPVPKGANIKSTDDTKHGPIPAAGTREDYYDLDHYCRTVRGEDADYRTQARGGDGVGHGSTQVATPETLTRLEDHGQPDAEIVRLEFGRRYLSDKP